LSAFALKLIALAAMLADHIGVVIQPLFIAQYLRMFGRLCFPIFAFLVSESCDKTKNLEKYAARLGIFAIASELPFDLFMGNAVRRIAEPPFIIVDFNSQNALFTLFLGCLAIAAHKASQDGLLKILRPAVITGVISMGYLLKTDYGAAGVLFIYIMHILPNGNRHAMQAASAACMSFYFYILVKMDWISLYYDYTRGFFRPQTLINLLSYAYMRLFSTVEPFHIKLFVCSALASALIFLYSDERGRRHKWFFYGMYPAHLMLLAIIWIFTSTLNGI
jgi:hypothetical protein